MIGVGNMLLCICVQHIRMDKSPIIGQEWYRGRYTKILAGIGQKIIIVYIVCTEQVQWKQEIESNYLLDGCLGYDYHKEDKSITVNEEEAETVRLIFDLYFCW